MKAARVHEFGGPEVLRFDDDVPEPKVWDDDLLVRVHAAALNRADLGRRSGGAFATARRPFIPGLECAGVVEQVGSKVEGFEVGQRVMGYPGSKCYAELVAAPADAFVPMPDNVTYEEGATIPVVFGTVWFALVKYAKLEPGETVLIQAAGSGVGIAGISLAKHIGARIITTAGTAEKIERARALGADEGIVYTEVNFAEEVMRLTNGRGVDVVLEQVGGETLTKSIRVLASRGRLVTVGNTARTPATVDAGLLMGGRTITGMLLGTYAPASFMTMKEVQTELRKVAHLFAVGKLQTVVDKVFPLEQAAEAHRYLEERRNFGKVVLRI